MNKLSFPLLCKQNTVTTHYINLYVNLQPCDGVSHVTTQQKLLFQLKVNRQADHRRRCYQLTADKEWLNWKENLKLSSKVIQTEQFSWLLQNEIRQVERVNKTIL